jgi:hypothetical protein
VGRPGVEVRPPDVCRRTRRNQLPLPQEDRAIAQALHGSKVVAHEAYGATVLLSDLLQLSKALPLEFRVAHGEDFIDNQHVGLEVCSDCERKPQVHA